MGKEEEEETLGGKIKEEGRQDKITPATPTAEYQYENKII